MQAGRASIVDADQVIDQSYIPFAARMALKWNNPFFTNALEFTWAMGTKTTHAKNLTFITP